MKKRKYSISVITIAKNEERTVKKVVEDSIKILSKIASSYEILVNDDASQDATPLILDKLAKQNRFIKVFHQKKPLGIADGLEFLYRKVRYELIFTIPGDGQYSIQDLPSMINEIEKGYDFVIGKRIKKKYNLYRNIISSCFNLIPGMLFGVKLYDAGSIKLYKKRILQDTPPSSVGVFGEAERIILAYKLGYKITSVPICHYLRKGGKATGANINHIKEALTDMLNLWISLKCNKSTVMSTKKLPKA